MNVISNCCGKSIIQLGDQLYSIGFKKYVCEECGDECRPVEVCEICNEESIEFISVDGVHHCPFCYEEAKERTGVGV